MFGLGGGPAAVAPGGVGIVAITVGAAVKVIGTTCVV